MGFPPGIQYRHQGIAGAEIQRQTGLFGNGKGRRAPQTVLPVAHLPIQELSAQTPVQRFQRRFPICLQDAHGILEICQEISQIVAVGLHLPQLPALLHRCRSRHRLQGFPAVTALPAPVGQIPCLTLVGEHIRIRTQNGDQILSVPVAVGQQRLVQTIVGFQIGVADQQDHQIRFPHPADKLGNAVRFLFIMPVVENRHMPLVQILSDSVRIGGLPMAVRQKNHGFSPLSFCSAIILPCGKKAVNAKTSAKAELSRPLI